MKQLSAIGRADLLEWMNEVDGLPPEVAVCYGYELLRAEDSDTEEKTESSGHTDSAVEAESQGSDQLPDPRLSEKVNFLLPIYSESRNPEPAFIPQRREISDQALSVPYHLEAPEPLPLIPWARMGFYVRHRLGASQEGRKIDDRKMVRLICKGEILQEIPKKQYYHWSPGAVLILDRSKEMIPFWDDLEFIRSRILAERGALGLIILDSDGPPARSDMSELLPNTPVFAVSAMGQLSGEYSVQKRWIDLGLWLRWMGAGLHCLMPCPRERWNPDICQVWSSAYWDRNQQLPRGRGLTPITNDSYQSGVESLLEFLSASTVIDSGLLRAVRLLLADRADVGAEYEFWFHEKMLSNHSLMAFKPGEAFEYSDKLKSRSAPEERRLKEESALHIQRFHETCSDVYAAEAMLRMCDASVSLTESQKSEMQSIFEGVAERLISIARDPGGKCGVDTGLARWVCDVFERIPISLRGNSVLSEAIALAYCYYGVSEIKWPEGIDKKAAQDALKRILEDPGIQIKEVLVREAESLCMRPFVPGQHLKYSPVVPLVQLERRREQFHFTSLRDDGSQKEESILSGNLNFKIQEMKRFEISTDTQAVAFTSIQRPEWVKRMGYDGFGLYMVLEVNAGRKRSDPVEFKMRWIPPGLFLMGEGEEQHEVTMSMGYWLAETQCTQELWLAVMGSHKNPSELIKGEKNLPVEKVSWDDVQPFNRKMEEWFPQLDFQLPTEAQWEYGCRAGTESDFNDGSSITDPKGKDRALDELGWFDENSGDKTHPVKQKNANAWGVYDMHGNVWEWCCDCRRDYSEKIDPNPVGPIEDSARHLLRGGSWYCLARDCRSAYRYADQPGFHGDDFGFRLAAGQKQGTGAVGLWMKGADAPWPWDKGEIKKPKWAERAGEDSSGIWAEFSIRGVFFQFRKIKAGTFMMGSPEDEIGRLNDEGPQHKVTISKAFWLAESPTTQAQWLALKDKNPSKLALKNKNPSNFKEKQRPVVSVSWKDSTAYCEKLNVLIPGIRAVLPTEAEWEYACRAGSDTAFNDGSFCTKPEGKEPALDELGWYNKNSEEKTHPVNQKKPNGWGLYDMHGNIWEWCLDSKREYMDQSEIDPIESTEASVEQVLRGGSCSFYAKNCRSASRFADFPGYPNVYYGFRLAAGHE